ncbi:MAG: MFS transporter [Patescibacteria group bacterium]|nr:MFS transporter [Patescibacteria group bacterium]
MSSFSASFLQPFFGYLADKTRKTFFIFIGPMLAAIFFSSLDFPTSYSSLLLFVFIGGVGVAAFHPVGAALVGMHSGSRQNTSMSWFVTGGNVGFSSGAIIITTIVTFGGLQSAYFAILPGLILVILLWKLFPEREFPPRLKNNHNHSPLVARITLFILSSIVTIRALIISGFITFIPLYVAEQGISLSSGGLTVSVFLGCGALGAFFGGIVADKIGEKLVILLSFVIPIPFLILYLYFPFPLNVISLAIGSFSLFSSISVVISVAQSIFSHRIGTVSSIVMGFCWGIGGLLITPAGWIAETIGLKLALIGIAGVAVTGIIAALFLYSKSFSVVAVDLKPAV